MALTFPACHRRGGIERVVLECANFLRSRGHEVHLISSQWDDASLAAGVTRVPVRVAGPSWVRMMGFARRSRRELALLHPRPDVHASFGVQSPPGGVMWVPSVHRAWLETSRKVRGLRGRIKQRLNPFHTIALSLEKELFAGRKYRRLIAHTEQVKSDLVRLYDVPVEDIEILPNGFSSSEFSADSAELSRSSARSELGYHNSNKVVLFVGNELERKGFGPLLRAISLLRDPEVKLLVVGRVNPESQLPAIAQSQMADRVRFAGPTVDVARYYAAADVFALPTQYESWGLVIVEALACGLPVVTSRLAGAATAVREGVTGELLDDPRDHLEIAAKLSAVLQRPLPDRHTVSASVSHLSWDQILPRYEQILISCARNVSQPALVGVN